MDERLTVPAAVFAFLAAGASATAFAQGLADPTRPPQVAPAGDGDAAGAAKSAHRLQSVLFSSTRKLAVIDGKTVPLGGEIGGAILTSINENGVTLRRGAETETLRLHPDVDKKQGERQ